MAGPVRDCILDTIHDDEHKVWDILLIWFLGRLWTFLCNAIGPRD